MSLFTRRAQRLPVPQYQLVAFEAVGYPHRLTLRGESHYMPQLRQLLARGSRYTAVLVRDPHNQFDPNAVEVQIEGTRVGFVAKEEAAIIAPRLDAMARSGQLAAFPVDLVGGDQERPNIGVFPV